MKTKKVKLIFEYSEMRLKQKKRMDKYQMNDHIKADCGRSRNRCDGGHCESVFRMASP